CFEGVEKLAHKLLHSKAEPVRKGEKRAMSILWDGRNALIVRGTAMRPLSSARGDPDPPTVANEVRRLIADGYSIAHVAKLTGVSRRRVDRYAWRSASQHRRPLHDPRCDPVPELDLTGRLTGDPWPGRRELIQGQKRPPNRCLASLSAQPPDRSKPP